MGVMEADTVGSNPSAPALEPGKNCWRTSRVDQGGFLLSGQEYFRAFREAVRRAEREVVILAWDISEAIEMVRTPEDDDGYPSCLAEFLMAVLDEKPELVVRILLWDYSLLYLAEREWLPFTRWRNPGHPRLELVSDDEIAVGASHHQKLVVVDGKLAFCGGFDLSAWRWDTVEHRAEDERRRHPGGDPYQPFHDVQMALSGPVVDDLRELASMRWERATGGPLPGLEESPGPLTWPEAAPVDFEDEPVAIALTFSRYEDYAPSRHIERLHLDVIAAARRYIYIENQYLSSQRIAEALGERLREPDGPEVVLVLTRSAGPTEEETLGVMRDRLLERLAEADAHGRLSSCHPHAEGGGKESQVYVHAKILIADDRMLLIGSANLSNRSMKVDSEVDLGFLGDEPATFIRTLLERLLAIHFQVDSGRIRSEMRERGTIGAAIAALREEGGNRLRVLEGGCGSELQRRLADSQLLDPDEPISPIHQVWDALRGQHEVWDKEDGGSGVKRWLKAAGWVGGLVVAGLVVHRLWAGLVDQERVNAFLAPIAGSPFAFPVLVLIVVAAGVLGVPLNLVIIGATLTLGPWQGFAGGFVGAMLAAAISHAIGHHFGRPVARRVAGSRVDALSAALADRSIWSVAVIRVLPIAPFGVMNLVAGISSLRFRVFMVGSAIGLLPGIAAVTLVARQFVVAVERPGWDTWGLFGLAAAVVASVVWQVRKRFS